jgi:hypothetical protein
VTMDSRLRGNDVQRAFFIQASPASVVVAGLYSQPMCPR